jgi:hypothetical protein
MVFVKGWLVRMKSLVLMKWRRLYRRRWNVLPGPMGMPTTQCRLLGKKDVTVSEAIPVVADHDATSPNPHHGG